MKLSVIEASDRLIDLINPDRPEVFEVEDPLMGPTVSNHVPPYKYPFPDGYEDYPRGQPADNPSLLYKSERKIQIIRIK